MAVKVKQAAFDEDKYDAVCPIGEGGCATCNLYRLKGTDSLRVVKVAKTADAGTKDLERFIREVSLLFKHKHPTIIHPFDYGIPASNGDWMPWLELDFIPGGTVYDLIWDTQGPDGPVGLDPTKTLLILYGVACGLAFLHKRDVIHRDIKTANILLDENLEPRLADFGFARPETIGPGGLSIAYTPNYAAPELVRESLYTNKVDVWAYGMMVYEMRTGEIPYAEQKGAVTKICQNIVSQIKPKLAADDPFAKVYEACTEFNPSLRPSMEDIAQNLCTIGDSIPGIDVARWHDYRDRLMQFDKAPYDVEDSGTIAKLEKMAATRPIAKFQLACLYHTSTQKDHSKVKAARYFQLAVKEGCQEAVIQYYELIAEGELPTIPKAEMQELTRLYEECTE
jgi:serine/threonine protein kinase